MLGGALRSLLGRQDTRPAIAAHDESTPADRALGIQRLVYRFVSNGSYFGITQLLGAQKSRFM